MAWYRNLRIVAKLMIGFLLVACTTAAVGYIGITNVKEIERMDSVLYNNMTVPITQVADIAVTYQRIRVNSRDVLLATTPQERQDKLIVLANLRKK